MKPSTHTLYQGMLVPNEQVIDSIKAYLASEPYCAYGYDMINDELCVMGYWINKKKTYRLMDENNLLMGKVIRCKGQRQWVQFRRIQATKPMEYLCLDIKYVWVPGDKRWYYLLSIMDVFSRKILVWIFQRSVRKTDVINLFRYLHHCFNLKGVIIRNDNGSQFIANQVRQFLSQLEAQQEFTHGEGDDAHHEQDRDRLKDAYAEEPEHGAVRAGSPPPGSFPTRPGRRCRARRATCQGVVHGRPGHPLRRRRARG
jgi:transposase InsO family protein